MKQSELLARARRANPVHPDAFDGVATSTAGREMLQTIIHSETTPARVTQRLRVRRIALSVAALLVVTAAAAAATVFGEGNLDPSPISGDGWQLVLGEGENGKTGTYKVCHTFAPAEGLEMANGLGPSGCVTWPPDVPPDAVILDAVPVETPGGMVLFVDLSAETFDTVSTTTNAGETIEVEPFRMPQSGKQFAVVELPGGTDSVRVDLLGDGGRVLESRKVRISH